MWFNGMINGEENPELEVDMENFEYSMMEEFIASLLKEKKINCPMLSRQKSLS